MKNVFFRAVKPAVLSVFVFIDLSGLGAGTKVIRACSASLFAAFATAALPYLAPFFVKEADKFHAGIITLAIAMAGGLCAGIYLLGSALEEYRHTLVSRRVSKHLGTYIWQTVLQDALAFITAGLVGALLLSMSGFMEATFVAAAGSYYSVLVVTAAKDFAGALRVRRRLTKIKQACETEQKTFRFWYGLN